MEIVWAVNPVVFLGLDRLEHVAWSKRRSKSSGKCVRQVLKLFRTRDFLLFTRCRLSYWVKCILAVIFSFIPCFGSPIIAFPEDNPPRIHLQPPYYFLGQAQDCFLYYNRLLVWFLSILRSIWTYYSIFLCLLRYNWHIITIFSLLGHFSRFLPPGATRVDVAIESSSECLFSPLV